MNTQIKGEKESKTLEEEIAAYMYNKGAGTAAKPKTEEDIVELFSSWMADFIRPKLKAEVEKALEHGRGWQMSDDKWAEFKQQFLSQYDKP